MSVAVPGPLLTSLSVIVIVSPTLGVASLTSCDSSRSAGGDAIRLTCLRSTRRLFDGSKSAVSDVTVVVVGSRPAMNARAVTLKVTLSPAASLPIVPVKPSPV